MTGGTSARFLAWILAAIVLCCGLQVATVERAAAQDTPAATGTVDASGKPVPRSATTAGKSSGKRDAKFGPPDVPHAGGQVIALLFWGFAALAIGGALFVVTRRNLITAVMGMVGTFFALAGLYMTLYASFLAIIQMLVYAGAIMVLFVFVVMILNKPEDEPYGGYGRFGKIVAGLAIAYLLFRVCQVLIHVDYDTVGLSQEALRRPPPTAQGYAWGSTASVGWNLFNDYLFPFEAVSILLLIAVVGAVAIARPLKDDVVEGADADDLDDAGPRGAIGGGHP
ncbi:MAG TPA: NADH-quinone oxidoreductase subunit J [Kofleriaceae bacterium]|nr:NADH-quinone oxidoreductase subunit J [Kofleriaceae bacterium]